MDDLAAPLGNVPEYTVSELSGAVKRTLEGAFGRVRVRGEITEMKRYSSGHVYFCLKDETAKMRAVAWRSAVPRLGLAPENGVEVIATGRLSSYPERSEYQLIIERLEYAGVGALLARIDLLRQRLAAEGLFEAARKRALPVLPRVIGVITSAEGAVIQDIRTTVARRFPRFLLLWPVPVQGEGAATRIAEAIRGFDRLAGDGAVPRPDVLIVARGGGSLEDLMAFNDEDVVRAVAACRIPLISAVGHETDTTLIDHVSDRRAPTPTAAAELAVPVRADLVGDLQHKAARLLGGLNRLVQECRLRLGRAERGLPDLPSLIGSARQRLDDRAERLGLALPNLLASRRTALTRVEGAMPDLPAHLHGCRERVQDRGLRLRLALPNLVGARRAEIEREGRLPPPHRLTQPRAAALGLAASHLVAGLRHAVAARRVAAARTVARLSPAPIIAHLRTARAQSSGIGSRLESVSYQAVLERGYALVSDARGRPLTTADSVEPGARLTLRFADGEVRARADPAPVGTRQGRLAL
jgi:exodeoxyribonuclease VII large subunit